MQTPTGGWRFVYLIEKPGSDVDGDDTVIRAETREEADALAKVRGDAWGCAGMRFIGRREGKKFVPMVPLDELPEWARKQPCTSCKDGTCMLCDDDGMVPVVVEGQEKVEREEAEREIDYRRREAARRVAEKAEGWR